VKFLALRNSFQIVSLTETYVLKADSEAIGKKWINTINKLIQELISQSPELKQERQKYKLEASELLEGVIKVKIKNNIISPPSLSSSPSNLESQIKPPDPQKTEDQEDVILIYSQELGWHLKSVPKQKTNLKESSVITIDSELISGDTRIEQSSIWQEPSIEISGSPEFIEEKFDDLLSSSQELPKESIAEQFRALDIFTAASVISINKRKSSIVIGRKNSSFYE